MRVELGAGARAAQGFLAVDVNPAHADVVADAMHLPFADGSVIALRAIDVLEHLSYRYVDRALIEWARVCASGAPFFVQVPDADAIMCWYANDDARLRHTADGPCSTLHGAEWRLLGGHEDGVYDDGGDWRWNAHYSLWSSPSLRKALTAHGFDVGKIETNGHPNLQGWAVRR